MNHKVNNVQQLYDNAYALYNEVVLGIADTIISDLSQGINNLKGCWEGKDAGVQIQNVVDVHNAMVLIRNVLAELSKSSSVIAVNYREIQNANKANLQTLSPLTVEFKTAMERYEDVRDTINISQEAMVGKNKIDAANNTIDSFITDVRKYYDMIMNNWQMGTGRDNAEQAFADFMNKSSKYKQILNDVSLSITEAIRNYTF